jgi:hypothetical protein
LSAGVKAALIALVAVAAVLRPVPAVAARIGITAKKLLVLDKLASAGKAKVLLVSTDAYVSKGDGSDLGDISASMVAAYDQARGEFSVPPGPFDGQAGWIANDIRGARFANRAAPGGPTGGKVVVLRDRVLRFLGKSLGDVPIDLSAAGPPADVVYAAFTVTNGGETNVHCSSFSDCIFTSIAGDTGRRLVCRGGVPDQSCHAVPCFTATPDGTVDAVCEALEWETKDGDDGVAVPGNLHDVENLYAWAGRCAISGDFCQPTAAAEAACNQQNPGSAACSQCTGESCDVTPPSITTIWDWLSAVNAAAYAGHQDWRMPEGDAFASFESELYRLVDCSFQACIDPVFGPTEQGAYWTSNTGLVSFDTGGVGTPSTLDHPGFVRAVRSLPTP